jgi:hypothetical protein
MRTIRLRSSEPTLDIFSYGRAGPAARPLTAGQIDHVRRTVSGAPEVMIKVTGGGGSTSRRGVIAHFSYIGRQGAMAIETDDGQRLAGRTAAQSLFSDWDLDLQTDRRRNDLFATNRRKPPKLIHKIVLSMPAGTPPKKVLSAVSDFAREEFGARHRYAMVLHTNEPHPHVHVVVKAVGEDGQRLNIRKETLRAWRREFAGHLRRHGVEANATERAVRGKGHGRKKDGIYRAALRGESTHIRRRVEEAARYIARGQRLPVEPGKLTMVETRRTLTEGWQKVAKDLLAQGERRLVERLHQFVLAMPRIVTERERIVGELLQRLNTRERGIERDR